MSYLWDQWRMMRVREDRAPALTAGRYVVVRESDIDRGAMLEAHLVCWDIQLVANLSWSDVADLTPDEEARVRYAMDHHPDDAAHLELRKTLSDLGSAYYNALDKIPCTLRPDDPESLTSPVYYAFKSPDSYLKEHHFTLLGAEAEEFGAVWARAIAAKEKLNAAERQLFGQ